MDKKIKIVLAIISCIGIIILTFDTLNMLKDPQIRKLYAQHLKNDIEDSLIHFKDEALWVKKNNIKIFAEKKDNENFGLRKNNIEHFTKANNILSSLLRGKLISSYFNYGTDTYDSIIHYKIPYNVKLVDDIIPVRHENYWGDVWYTYKKKYHTETWFSHRTKIKQIKYDYYYSLSVYDISDIYSIFKTKEKTTSHLFNDFYQQITEPKWKFSPNFYWRSKNDTTKAISHITTDKNGTRLLQSIFFANSKAYLLEVCANHDLTKRANFILSNITTSNPKKTRTSVQNNFNQRIYLLIIFTLIYIYVILLRKNNIKNKVAFRLFYHTLIMTFITSCVIAYEWYLVYTNYLVFDNYFKLIIFTLTANLLLFNFTLLVYLRQKNKNNYTYDFLLPKFIIWYFNKRKTPEPERKLYTAIVCYPLFIIGVLPFGIIIFLLYVLPISIIFIVITEIKTLITWITHQENKPITDITFLNYYLILDLPTTAKKNDIEKKFLNWYIENKGNVNNNDCTQINEAYKVLTSNYLRPIYDIELEHYTKSETYENYVFKNKLLQYHIKTIRKGLSDSLMRKNNYTKSTNKVFISLIIFIFIFLLLFIPKKQNTSHKNRIKTYEIEQINEQLNTI